MSASTRALQGSFNDALYGKQWNVENDGTMADLGGKSVAGADVQVVEAWKKSTGDSSVVVAVLDEGIDIEHDDLAANIWVNPAENGTWNEDKDGNGYKGDKHGYNFDTPVIIRKLSLGLKINNRLIRKQEVSLRKSKI